MNQFYGVNDHDLFRAKSTYSLEYHEFTIDCASRNRVGSTGNNARNAARRYLINDENEFQRFLVEARLPPSSHRYDRSNLSSTKESAVLRANFPHAGSAMRFQSASHLCVNERVRAGNPHGTPIHSPPPGDRAARRRLRS